MNGKQLDLGICSGAYITSLDPVEFEKGARALLAEGYRAYDFSPISDPNSFLYTLSDEEFRRTLTTLREISERVGVYASQLHSYWEFPYKRDVREEAYPLYEKSLYCAKYLGCKYSVMHPIAMDGWDVTDNDEMYAFNFDLFSRLGEVAAREGVYCAVENLPFKKQTLSRVEPLVDFLKKIDNEAVVMCLDVGHVNVFGEDIGDAIRTAGDLLKVLHVHDNKGDMDYHLLPREGTVNWKHFAEGLSDIGFTGVVSLETAISRRKVPDPAERAVKMTALYRNIREIADWVVVK